MCLPVYSAEVLAPPDASWLHIYVRNRQQLVVLESATNLLRQGRLPETAAQLQYLFDQPDDSWMTSPTGDVASVRQQGWLLLVSDAKLVETYRRLMSPNARQELAQARENADVPSYLGVVRRYFATEEGYRASEWLVRYWLDDGDWMLAASLSTRVLASQCHQRHVTPRFLNMATVACELAGWPTAVEQGPAPHSELRMASVVNDHVISDGSAAGPVSRESATFPPVLDADWDQGLESTQIHPQVESVLQEWLAAQRESEQSTAVGWAPVMAGNQLILRELDIVRSIDASSGKTLWRYRTSAGMGNLLIPSEQNRSHARYRSAMWEAAAANSLVSGLSTDDRRVFLIDDTETLTMSSIYGLDSQLMPQFTRRESSRNHLIALDVRAAVESARLLWSTADSPQFAGHAFLGPPLTMADVLYVISERDREICVTALHSASGRVLWQQPIAEAERSVVEDRGRSSRACQPVAAGELILCPTNIGLLVAVDAVTGTLRWVHNSLKIPPDVMSHRFRNVSQLTQRHHSAFAGSPLVRGNRVVYLPSQSNDLYCLNASTGEEFWQVENAELECLAMVDDERVVALGHVSARAYALDDKRLLWTTPFPEVVAGQGVKVFDGFLVPLESGQVAHLELESGRLRGSQFQRQSGRLGHLIATEDRILSVGALGIAAYPQTKTVLQRLALADSQPLTAAHSLKLAEVHLAEGDPHAAVKSLEAAWAVRSGEPQQQQVQQMLWDVYFQLVRDDADRAELWLKRLQPLLEDATPGQRARWLVVAMDHAQLTGNVSGLAELLRQLSEQPARGTLFECPRDRDRQVSAVVWLRQVLEDLEDDSFRADLLSELATVAAANPASEGAAVAERLLPAEEATPLRLQQSQLAIAQHDLQRAAILLQRARNSTSGMAAADSELATVRLFLKSDLTALATQSLASYRRRYAPQADSQNLAKLLGDEIPTEGLLAAWERRQDIPGRISQVMISSRPRPAENLGLYQSTENSSNQAHLPYEDYQRPIPSIPAESPLEWMTRNTGRGTEIGVFDKVSSRKLCEHVLPFGAMASGCVADLSGGTLVPFCMPGEVRALSPLQGNREFVAWQLSLPEWTPRSAQAVGGPASARVAFFQWKHVLFAVDPADGQLLWRRDDLDASSGLYTDPRIGVLASGDVVFVLGTDKTSYRLFEAETGRLVRSGNLDQDVRFARYDLAGTILHIHDTGDQRQIRIWDPETNTLLLDDSLRSRQLMSRFSADAVAWLTGDSRLKIYSVGQRRMLVDVELQSRDVASAATLKVFAQNGWHLVSIGRNQQMATTRHFHMPIADKLIAGDNFRDDVLAIGPEGDRVRWRKTIPHRTLLAVDSMQIPLVVAGCLVRDKRDPNRRWLRVEAWDLESGLLLGVGDDLPNDKLLHADYDATQKRITLIGRRTDIELDLSPRGISPWLENQPF